MQLTATTPVARTAHAATDRNPWGFPAIDPVVARRAVDGLEAGARIVDRLIDRSIAVRVQLDRDIKAGVFSPDTARAVELLARARTYAHDTIRSRHLSYEVTEPIHDWVQAHATDTRLPFVGNAIEDIKSAIANLVDDEEGNVRETIAAMRTEPNHWIWESIRESVDMGLARLYGAREVSGELDVLRAAGEL